MDTWCHNFTPVFIVTAKVQAGTIQPPEEKQQQPRQLEEEPFPPASLEAKDMDVSLSLPPI